jgi:outer membrane protein assembly factor BamB
VLWRVVLGEGYAGAAIRSGCVYVLDYDEGGQTDTLRCLSLDDGREIWRNGYPVQVTRNHGISRTVPALAGDCVITIGPRCHVACWDATTGECRWLMDLVRQYGTQEPRWYTGQCPFIDGDRLILAPCGDALLMAVDSKTGSVIWRTPNPRRWQMTHVSIMPMDVAGRRTYVYCGSGGVAGVAADNGALLWECVEWPVQFAHAPSPLVLPADRILLSSGYGNDVGGLVLQLRATGDKFVAEVAARLTPKQFNSEQQTPILMGDHILGTRKRTAGQLVCLDLRGNEVWNSGSDRFGHGPYLLADGLVLAMDNSGKLTLAEVSSAGYRRLASSQALENGVDAWGPMALVAGRLIVRDMTRMVCLDVGEH